MLTTSSWSAPPKNVRGIYLTPQCFGQRKIAETIHYAKYAGLNAAVLHVKDPHGRLHWQSNNATAKAIGANGGKGNLRGAVKKLNDADVWTIAKVDLFQDTLLSRKRPELAILDTKTGKPWRNRIDLSWVNPYDKRVWAYDIALAKELVAIGFDEIQFDYIRFPSDGNLKRLRYQTTLKGKSKTETIGAFAKAAHDVLHPLGATLSVDLFGMVAWKTDDFGVGQLVEDIAPNVDVICPMVYPSHYPRGFLGKADPSAFPRQIVEQSVRRLRERTKTEVRPWLQGFWYEPEQVSAQLDAVDASGASSWLMWNPSARYDTTYIALSKRAGKKIPDPKLYASLAELSKRPPRVVRGIERVVNYSDFMTGYSILSLEASKGGRRSAYGTPSALLSTLDEAVVDRILKRRGVTVSKRTSPLSKVTKLTALLCKDTNASPRCMRPRPIYIDWTNGCRFTTKIPVELLKLYASLGKEKPKPPVAPTAPTAPATETATAPETADQITMAAPAVPTPGAS